MGGEFSVLDAYGETRLFLLSAPPPSNSPESAESTDFTEWGSSQGSSPGSPTPPSLAFSCGPGPRGRGSRRAEPEGGSREPPGDVEEEELEEAEEEEEDTGRNQPRLGVGLLWGLRYCGEGRPADHPPGEPPETATPGEAKAWTG